MPDVPTVFRFGRFQLDTREQRLTRDGEVIGITPRVFDTLAVFVRHAGRLLTKAELLEAIWPDTSVEEANLTVNVSALRKLLAAGDGSPCIETVPRRGYRFMLSVEIDREPASPSTPQQERPASPRACERTSAPIRRRTKPITGKPHAISIRRASRRRRTSRPPGRASRDAIG